MSVGPKQSPSETRCRTEADELTRAVPRFYDGEMLRGHKARVKALLGIPSDGTLYRVLQRATGQELVQAQSYARLLAPIFDLSFEEILDHHSLYPLAFAFDRERADQVPDVLRETRETHAPAFRRPAAFCPICFGEDRYPYFRRDHQIPGVFWCAKHRCSLEFVKTKGGTIKVIPCSSQWFGVTYKEDAPVVKASIDKLVADGEYPSSLW